MPIFYPDNENRKKRIIELASDTENYLHDATNAYQDFKNLLEHVNEKVAAVYKESGLNPPSVRTIDIFKEVNKVEVVDSDETILKVIEVVADIAGLIPITKFLCPAVTRVLVSTGVMAEETALKLVVDLTVPLIQREVQITAGEIAGSILGGIVGGIAIVGFDFGLEAIEGSKAKTQLRDGIHKMHPMRVTTKISLDQTCELYNALLAIATTMDALEGSGVILTEDVLENLIKKDVIPSLKKSKEITASSIKSELKQLDHERKSWTEEDEH